jgi:polyhydroxybutyrate depolymerase
MLYKINNGGHAEPSQTERYGNFFLSIVGNQNGDFEMANEIWEFFKEKSN